MQLPPLRSWLESLEHSDVFCPNVVKLACGNDGGGITSLCDGDVTGSSRTGEIEGVGAVELVCVGRLSRMGGESLLLPVWRSVGGGFTGKGE